jgi:non-specific serine/threonine protein kinase
MTRPLVGEAHGVRRNNLPARRDTLIGHASELATAHDLLLRQDVGLLTLTGPGGVGKSRLALEIATALLDSFQDGIFLVELASLREPSLVASTITRTLGIRETEGVSAPECLTANLERQRVLLVLDNFEHLLPATPMLAALLAACPRLKLLVTSRAVLHLSGEHDLPVPPLHLPEGDALVPIERLAGCEAVQLFIERAQAAAPAFRLTDDNATAVVEICRRLDGLPLALELAASKVRLLPPHELLSRLDAEGPSSPLQLLAGGPRDRTERQQSLRATIAWSYDLLNEAEKTLLRRLAVFAGDWSLDGAEAVGAVGPRPDMLNIVASLIDQSLVYQTGEGREARFGLLKTVRGFALEQLNVSGEAEMTHRRHAEYALSLAEAAEPELRGPNRPDWMQRLDKEQANLRAAQEWLHEQKDPEGWGLRLAVALWRFWLLHTELSDGLDWLRRFVALADPAAPVLNRAHAVPAGGEPAVRWEDCRETRELLEQALLLCGRDGSRLGTLPIERAVEEALSAAGSIAPTESAGGDGELLSAREREVAALVARGLTNRRIADELVIAKSTVDRHVVNILRKLVMENRAQVAVWAAEHGALEAASLEDGTGR